MEIYIKAGAEEKDLKRQKALEAVGFTVLRFEDSMILDHLTTALSIVEQEVESLAKLKN